MPTTAMPATRAPPIPESEGGSCRGVASSEYVGSGDGDAAAAPGNDVAVVGVAGGSGVADAVGCDEASSTVGVGEDDADVEGSAGLEGVPTGSGACVASGVRVGLGEGFGDFVGAGVGVGSAITSAQPRAG